MLKIFVIGSLIYSIICLSIDKSKESSLESYIPKIIQSEVKPKKTSCYIALEYLDWYPNSITYTLYISEMNEEIWYEDEYLMSNSIYSNGELINYILSNNSLWNEWSEKYSGSKRIIKLTDLNEGSFYRIKYKISSRFTTSQFSEVKLIPLQKANTKVNIFVQGTGRNNHDNAIVTLNNNIILKHGKFQGLVAITLNRKNLSVSSIKFFDTYHENTQNEIKTVEYIKYSYDDNGNIITNNENTTIETIDPISENNNLLKFLEEITISKILIIVSCYGWEKFFLYETAEYLSIFGALKIKEMANSFFFKSNEDKFREQTILNQNLYHHPYAFIGIKGIGVGNGFEVIQTNKGNYLSTENLPHAFLIVSLSFNKFNRAYYFNYQQDFIDNYNLINYDYLYNSLDLSLKELFPFLLHSNLSSSTNSQFNIYDKNTLTDNLLPFDSNNDNNNNIYQTELDRVVVGDGIGVMRSYFKGGIYQNGINIYEMEYYNFYLNAGLKSIECLPPYNVDNESCIDPNIIHNYTYDIPIIMCGIGIQPQLCEGNEEIINNDFSGFD